jgi:cytochrome c5
MNPPDSICIEGNMSDEHNEHETAIKTPKQLIAAIIAGFLVPIICIVLLVQYVTHAPLTGAGSSAQDAAATEARIRPVASLEFRDANAPRQYLSGEEVYKNSCLACHGAGIAGAPKVGDAAAWKARIGAGYNTLLSHALNGIGAMPAKGGSADLEEIEVARAVVLMANQSGAQFKEPAEPAPTTPAAAPEPAAK